MRLVKGYRGRFQNSPVHIGFIKMEPQSLFVPQYLDSNLVIFIHKGEARVGHIYKDQLAERRLKKGDVYTIPAGSAFYLVNTAEEQTLHVICSIDTTESQQWKGFQTFFIGGGSYPTSVLAGFEPSTLSAALNVSTKERRSLLTRQESGAIVHLSKSRARSVWADFMELEEHHRLAHLERIVQLETSESEEGKQKTWSWMNLLVSVPGEENNRRDRRTAAPESYNLYNKQPDFKNNYGWSKAVDQSEYSPLRHSDIGVYLVNLESGSMLAPHVNPRATEYGIVLRGSGTIQVVYPDGTLAMKANVREGDMFWVPRYFPVCQIASRNGPMELFGFTTSARNNQPQFLAGAGSLIQTMRGPELAAAFGISEERLKHIAEAQRESIILPMRSEQQD